jgi:polyisoprenyl-phosphate glycosyltransferase
MNEAPTRPIKPLLAAILPCYNEARNIRDVLSVLRNVEEINEIIVVDDGSADGSAEVVAEYAPTEPRLKLIRHPTNLGKGRSMFDGWVATEASYLLFLDTDLKNLTPGHIHALIDPVLKHRADMTLGLFRGGRLHTDFAHWVTPWLTGQRCLRADIMKYVSQDAATGYGFEVALTVAAAQRKERVRIVALKGMYHPPSEFHRGFFFGIRWRARMYGQILRAWYVATSATRMRWKTYFSSFTKS